jgi:DNA-binding response OmpR family regulator
MPKASTSAYGALASNVTKDYNLIRETDGGALVDVRGTAVLVVDDDEDDRAHLVRALSRAGLTVHEATGGDEALELAVERPGAVVLEVDLHDVDGLEVCRELRERHGDDLPLIMVSAHRVSTHDRVAGLLIGADDYLAKPVNGDELVAKLRRLVARSRSANANRETERRNSLSPREIDVLRLLALGLDSAAISGRLVITPKTVASHIQRVMAKLGVHSRAQAVAEAYRLGLVNGDFEGHALDDGSARMTIEGRPSSPSVVVR